MRPPPSFTSTDGQSAEPFDDKQAERLVGQYALVGVVWVSGDREISGEYHGRIVTADRDAGIVVACEGRWKGKTLVLPPAPGWFDAARRGEYRLRSTGEVVTDPDVVSTWRINPGDAE